MPDIRQKSSFTRTEIRLARFLDERILPRLYRSAIPLKVTHRAVGGEPLPFAEGTRGDFLPLPVGARWGRPWDTVWMRVSCTVPTDWVPSEQRRIEAVIDFGFSGVQPGFEAEGLAWTLDGRPFKALSPFNAAIPFDAKPGDAIDFWIEAAANPNLLGTDAVSFTPTRLGEWETAGDDPIYRLLRADLALLDVDVYDLVADIRALEGLMKALPETTPRRFTIARALERMLDVVDPDDVSGSALAGRAALAAELAKPAVPSAHTIHAVGHAHIDSAWLWPLRETVRKCARTFTNVLELMDQHPDFTFACSSAQQFAWMKEYYPELFERIREKVAGGQFVPVGGMWVESDTNMPGGESMARQFIAGQKFFLEEFGLLAEEVWLPDSFGFSGALPQIARQAGARWFLSQKLSWNQINRMPHHTFSWEGIDGTRIFAHFPPVDTYNSDLSPAELTFAERNFADHGDSSMSLVPYGWGDGGGGPTREMIDAGRRARDLEGSPRVTFSTPRRFFEAAEAENLAPATWSGEMYLELHRGTYTSQSRTKRGNRHSEALLRQAEMWAATAAVRNDSAYPYDQLESMWQSVLLHQFHDILPGSSIAWVHRQAERRYAELRVELEALVAEKLGILAGDGSERVEFNASPAIRGGIPAMGGSILRHAPEPAAARSPITVTRTGGGYILDTGRISLTIDGQGLFVSLVHVDHQRDLFSPDSPGNLLQVHRDIPNEWDAWDIDDHYRRVKVDLDAAGSVAVDDNSPADGCVRVNARRTTGDSTFTQTITLSPGSAEIRIETTVDWREREKLVKLAFPFRLDAQFSSSETQFGHVRRDIHTNTSWQTAKFEVCAHRWVHVGEPGFGIAVANDTSYGHDFTREQNHGSIVTTVRQTLLRAPMFPDPESDQGEHVFRTVLVVGAGITAAIEAGYAVNTPTFSAIGGRDVEPLMHLEADGVFIETIKLAEDRSGDVIVRLYEGLGRTTAATLRLGFEVSAVMATDLLERETPEVHVALGALGATVQLRPFQLLTLRLVPGARAASSGA